MSRACGRAGRGIAEPAGNCLPGYPERPADFGERQSAFPCVNELRLVKGQLAPTRTAVVAPLVVRRFGDCIARLPDFAAEPLCDLGLSQSRAVQPPGTFSLGIRHRMILPPPAAAVKVAIPAGRFVRVPSPAAIRVASGPRAVAPALRVASLETPESPARRR